MYTVIPRKRMEKEEVDELEGVDQLARCSPLVGSLRSEATLGEEEDAES